jgi:hypothetical protein
VNNLSGFLLLAKFETLKAEFGFFEDRYFFWKIRMYTLSYSRNGTIVGSIITFIITLLSKL